MSDFSERLKQEIEFKGLLQKEVAAQAGIKKRALDMYLGSRSSMPSADAAVKLAQVLGVTVEYLVTGSDKSIQKDFSKYEKYRDILDDLSVLPAESVEMFRVQIHAVAETAVKNKSGVQAG